MANKPDPVIGKFVIESLTIGMYDDPRSIYREYVQNSADAIDKAIAARLIDKRGAAIDIKIEDAASSISFEDNGTGIPQANVISFLQDIAKSEKELGKNKGFRGIGRLGGLAYCDRLIFETSYSGEPTRSIMTWDAKKLRQLVGNRAEKEDAVEVIRSVTEFVSEKEDAARHYFKVRMVNVTNPELLNKSGIIDYLRMVAPVPFDGPFIYRKTIKEEAAKQGILIDEYELNVNGDPIYKGYTTQLYGENNGVRTKIGEVIDVRFFSEKDRNGKPIFWGWHSISNIQNIRLKKVNKARALRLRKDNIQIGDENRLTALFRDTRFNFYVIGEVYAQGENLVPNGRRDDFEDTPEYSYFKEKLRRVCNEIQNVSYDTSKISNAKRHLEDLHEFTSMVAEKKRQQGVIDHTEITALETEFTKKRDKALRAEKTISKFQEKVGADDNGMLGKVLAGVVPESIPPVSNVKFGLGAANAKTVFRTDKLSQLTKAERKLMSKVFSVIKSVLPNELAENLIQKLEEEFK